MSTQVLERQDARPGDALRVAVLLSDTWKGDVLFHVDAFEQTCDAAPVASQVLQASPTDKGEVTQTRLELAAEDMDQDGFVSAARGGTDCNDANANIHPGALERCNGVDDNCVDGESDAVDAPTWYADMDLDGHGGTPVRVCVAPAGTYVTREDCDDRNRLVHPGQSEVLCDGRDDNCDGDADEGFNVGAACTTAQNLPGRLACDAAVPSRTVCTALPSAMGSGSSDPMSLASEALE
ncbi:putative metal-binding motif-containing protein [Corallococcus exercitus]|uniref:putative metal-binding motif-containing protein n=1 Tax=Corallococcus exercitus TaxID=2316736 RepID=UPI0013153CF3|nr:putative metal-binding motif-containing protein [Corallococcus exercitus]